ncbi:MAG: hypothetical protein QOJ12_3039 [Thermoleophilales bacterium]|nr:hypothetical protein [Thermoleophilales bacterium]
MAGSPRRGALAVLAAMMLALVFATQASAAGFTVDTTADTSDADLSIAACDDGSGKCSLRAAIQQASDAGGSNTVSVPAGHYVFDTGADALVADGDLTITGAGARTTVIDANGQSTVFAVLAESKLTMSGVTVRGGAAPVAGGFLVFEGASLDLTDSIVTRNNGLALGGGILAGPGSSVKLTRVDLSHNLALLFGGGGIANAGGFIDVVDSTIHANRAGIGGGGALLNGLAGPTQTPCVPGAALPCPLISALLNQAESGPAVPGYSITGSTVSDNVAGLGGGGAIATGLVCACGPIGIETVALTPEVPSIPFDGSITNSTISGNSAIIFGGAIAQNLGTLAIESSTIANGDGLEAGGLIFPGNLATVTARNSVFAGGTTAGEAGNCDSAIQSLGNNLDTGDTCGLHESTDLINTDPQLGPLTDNGGLTDTHALLDGSPAIDKGANGAGPELDQRGGDRPPAGGSAGDTRDIGAYEAYSLADLAVEAKSAAPDPATAGQPLTYSIVVRNNGPDKVNGVTLTDPLPAGTELVSADSFALGTLEAGAVRTVKVVVRPTAAGPLTNTATLGAAGITDPKPTNDSATATTQVNPAPLAPSQPNDADTNVAVTLTVPKTASLDEFMNGILVEADCKDEPCLRRFREHAAINTGASHIAGFNLTVSRGFLSRSSKQTKLRLRPCASGAKHGSRHKRCLTNLRKAAKKAGKFKVKVVVSVVDAAGNKAYAKKYITIQP